MCLIFLFSAFMYLTKYEMVEGYYNVLGFPTWIIYPLAVVKILGVIAVLAKKSQLLKEWAYAGFFFDATLATAAHYHVGHGLGLSLGAVLLIIISRIFEHRYFNR